MFWEIVGKVSLVLGVVFTVQRILAAARGSRQTLSAVLEFERFVLPSKAIHTLRRIEWFDGLQVWEELKKAGRDCDHDDACAVFDIILQRLKPLTECALEDISTVVHGSIRNRGNVPLKDVQMRVPGGVLASAARDGHDEQFTVIDGILGIGELLPGAEVDVHIWSRSRMHRSGLASCVVSHSTGTADTERLYRVNQRWHWLASNIGNLVPFVFVLIVTLAAAVAQFTILRSRATAAKPPISTQESGVVVPGPSEDGGKAAQPGATDNPGDAK